MEFNCDEGFILIGSVVRQCQANKTWSGTDTSCEGEAFLDPVKNIMFFVPDIFCSFLEAIDCGFLGVPLNGSSFGDLIVFPNTKRFTCDAGFLLGGSSERTCQANGTWSGINATCTG